jgi:hypothetical protein
MRLSILFMIDRDSVVPNSTIDKYQPTSDLHGRPAKVVHMKGGSIRPFHSGGMSFVDRNSQL